MDRVRVIRILEYDGDREWVEETIKRSITGERICDDKGYQRRIRAVTLSTFPEVLGKPIIVTEDENE